MKSSENSKGGPTSSQVEFAGRRDVGFVDSRCWGGLRILSSSFCRINHLTARVGHLSRTFVSTLDLDIDAVSTHDPPWQSSDQEPFDLQGVSSISRLIVQLSTVCNGDMGRHSQQAIRHMKAIPALDKLVLWANSNCLFKVKSCHFNR